MCSSDLLANGLDFEENPCRDEQAASVGLSVLPENTEINNMTDTPNNTGINNGLTSGEEVIQKPQIKEIVISRPVAEGKGRPKAVEQPQKAVFEF